MYLFQEPAVAPQWLYDPRFWILAGGTVVAVILWFGRLEFKTNANGQRIKEHEELFDETVKESKAERGAIKKDLYAHIANPNVHHNEGEFNEFKKGLDLRFNAMHDSIKDMKVTTATSLQEINRKLDHLADRD